MVLSGVVLANTIWLIVIIIGFGLWQGIWYLDRKKYPIKVKVHGDLMGGNNSPLIGEDRARLIRIGEHGEQIYYLKKHKVFRVGYGRHVGLKTIAFTVQDGNWYNIVYSGIDKRLMELGIEPLDRNIRLVAEAVVETTKNQFKSTAKNNTPIIIALGVIIVLAISGFILYKNIKTSNEVAGINLEREKLEAIHDQVNYERQQNITEAITRLIAHIENIDEGGGLIPA